ncbi:uncharacterized protein [Procambarus clarkii]|uniref:uncharacterized protein n=1 Tax=Procambarus clarkii TaxID=6728 RepID=UPI00374283F6
MAVVAGAVAGRWAVQAASNPYFDPPDAVDEVRSFLQYNDKPDFNSSVAFTIPLFTFTMPGAGDFTAIGLSSQSFGVMTFLSLLLLGLLSVAAYNAYRKHPFAREFSDSDDFLLTRMVLESFSDLPGVVDTRACANLGVCGAYAERDRYGMIAWPIRFLVQYSPDTPEDLLTEFQKAARDGQVDEQVDGQVDGQVCRYKYPCFMQPLDHLLYLYNYWYGGL